MRRSLSSSSTVAMWLTVFSLLEVQVSAFSSSSSFSAPPLRRDCTIQENRSSFLQGPPTSRRSLSQLFVATDVDDVAIRGLDRKMEEYNRRKEKVVAKLEKMDQELNNLQQKKQQYLEGLKLGIPQEKNFSETTARSAVKAFMWRIIAGTVTFFTSLRFSGSVKTAISIVGSDFFSKAFTMFFGERLMNKSKAGRQGGADNAGRSLAKALIWRLFAIANTLTMSLLIAKDLSMASKIAGSDAIFKTGLMFAYERVWAKIEWGKEYEVEFSI